VPIAHVIVTPLPNGATTQTPRTGYLSVHLAPRLREVGRLRDYPAWRNWPGWWTARAGFQVRVDGLVRPHTIVSPPPDPDVWRAVFGPPNGNQIEVKEWTFVDRTNPNLTSQDPTGLADATERLYEALVSGLGDNQPTTTDVLGAGSEIFSDGGLLEGAQTYYGTPLRATRDVGTIDLDFHAALAQLGAHPTLLRHLGLVFDLEVDLPAGFNTVTVLPSGLGPPDAFPVPMTMQVNSDFRAKVRDAERLDGGWLRLANADVYDVSVIDLPSLTHRLTALADQLDPDDGTVVDVPSLEEGGVAVWQRRRAEELAARWQRQKELELKIDEFLTGAITAPEIPALFYDDVLVGARLDIQRGDNQWRSVFERRLPGGYVFPRNSNLTVTAEPDEGWHSNALLTDGGEEREPQTSDVIYGEGVRKSVVVDTTPWRVPDTLARWKGWSLAVAKPGKALEGDGRAIDQPADEPEPTTPIQLVADYRIKNGSLPKLRYDSVYQVRARAVDLAGNSLAPDAAEPTSAVSEQVRFGRMAVVEPPLLARRHAVLAPGVGDTLETIVIKSDLDTPINQVEPAERLLFPPSISQPRLELHGLPRGGTDPGSYQLLADRDAVSLADQTVIDEVSGDPAAGTIDGGGNYTPGPLKPPVLYLPDPAAEGACFYRLPGTRQPVVVGMGRGWPDKLGARLVLRGGKGRPRVNRRQLTVTAKLLKGRIQTVEVSSSVTDAYVSDFFWNGEVAADQQAGVEDLMRQGRHALFSGRRLVTLVHAVRQPITPPSLLTMAASRLAVGGTQASVSGTVRIDRPSTGRLVVGGTWVDPVDDLSEPGPGEQTRSALVGSVDVPYGRRRQAAVENLVFDLRDTKRHRVRLGVEAFSRYSDYFTEEIRATFGAGGRSILLDAAGVVAASVTVAAPGGRVFEAGVDYTVNGRTGRVKHLRGGAIRPQRTLVIRYIPQPTSRLSAEAPEGATLLVDVAASTAPLVPDVEAVVPGFLRTEEVRANRIVVVHNGQVLRVLLKRPWYSAGVGELLGVAVEPGGGSGVPTLTAFGRDGVNAGTGPVDKPVLAELGATTDTATAGEIGADFDVAGYRVTYDGERQLWTGDVLIDRVLGYRPFVQLALCRFQPNALSGQHVSPVVLADAVRLGASRVVTVTRGTGEVTVRLQGPDRVNEVQVTVQEADPDIADDDLRWRDLGSPTVLARTGTEANASHSGVVTLPASSNPLRLFIEDREPRQEDTGGATGPTLVTAYVEVVDLPAAWT
jgi:hypothetical protein